MIAQAMIAMGDEVWVADETALREFPPLWAGWSRRGETARVVISRRNTRRTILWALHVGSGELVQTVRERCRTDDVASLVYLIRHQVAARLVERRPGMKPSRDAQ